MKPPARVYQKQITGRTGEAYFVGAVSFDGFSDGALIEAKGPGYANFVRNGKFRKDRKARWKLLRQAQNKTRVANGFPIVWHVAESKAADAMRALFDAERISGITIYHTAAIYKRARR